MRVGAFLDKQRKEASCVCVRARACNPDSPGVKLVNDALEANDSEEPGAEAGQPGQEQDGEGQQGLPPGRLRQAAGQTSPSGRPGVAAWLRHRRAAASVPRVRRSGGQRRFVFVVRGRVMLRHVIRQSRLQPFFSLSRCHAPPPKRLAPPSLLAPVTRPPPSPPGPETAGCNRKL